MKHLILLSVFFAMPALASLDGLWVGTGSWSYEGSDVPCRMKLNYRETETELTRLSGDFDCQLVGLVSERQSWTKKDGALILADEIRGAYTARAWTMSEDYSDTVTVETEIQKQGPKLIYRETWKDEKGTEIYLITGELSKRP